MSGPSENKNMVWAHSTGAKRYNPTLLDPTKVRLFRCWPMVIRLDAWMEIHTSNWPILSAYAVNKNGEELHIEHAAADLGIDEANMRKAWRVGVRMAAWGNRPHPKAHPKDTYQGKRRLYRYGAIDLARAETEAGKPDPEEATPESYEKVCTNLFGLSIWKQIKDLPKEQIELWKAEERVEETLSETLHADLVAAFRVFTAQRKDNRWSARGVKVNRQEHTFKNGQAAAHQERREIVEEVYAPVLLPLLEAAAVKRSVQTSKDSVQSAGISQDTVTSKVSTEAVTLLGSESHREAQMAVRAGESNAPSRRLKPPPVEQQSPPIQQYEPEEPEPSAEEQKAIDLLFEKTREMQDVYPDTAFGSVLVSPANKGDMIWARKVLAALGNPADMEGFCYQCAIDLETLPRPMGTMPRTRTRPPAKNARDRFIPLFVEWAEDYKEAASKRDLERQQRAARQVEIAAREKDRAAKEAYERYCEQETGRRMEALDPEERDRRIKAKIPTVKSSWPKMTAGQLSEMAGQLVRAELRPSLEEFELHSRGENARGASGE